MTDQHRQGTTATLLAQFYAYAGGPAADVTGLTVTISPTGGGAAVVGPTGTGIVNESTGLYSYPWAIDADADLGTYVVEWNADGGVTAAETVEVIAGFADFYGTLAELKSMRRITDTADDTELTAALTRASRAIDRRCGRRFYADSSASARTWPTRGRVLRPTDGELLLVDDISTLTGLVVEVGDGTAWTAVTDYFTTPDNALVRGVAITGLKRDLGRWSTSRRVRVTAAWGWPAVPHEIDQAALLLANRRFMRRDSPEGVSGWADQGPVRVSRFDPDIEDLVAPYVLPGVG